MGVGPSQGEEPENRLLMEEASLTSALGLSSLAGADGAQRLQELSAAALASEFRGSPEVGPTLYPDSYFLILDMNGLLLEKRPSPNGRDMLYTLREDVGEFLEFCFKSFEVAFWSCCNQKNLKSMIQSLKRACTPSLAQQLQRCRTFDQDWCDVVCDSNGDPVTEGPYFFVKPLDTLFDHPNGLKGKGASVENTLLIDDSPYKNVRNGMWSAVHPLPFHIVNEPAGTAWFRHQLIPWLRRLKQSGQTVPRFCKANQGFGQRRLLPDDGEATRVLLSCMPGPRALELA